MAASITVAASVIFDEYVLDSLTAIKKINKSDTLITEPKVTFKSKLAICIYTNKTIIILVTKPIISLETNRQAANDVTHEYISLRRSITCIGRHLLHKEVNPTMSLK